MTDKIVTIGLSIFAVLLFGLPIVHIIYLDKKGKVR